MHLAHLHLGPSEYQGHLLAHEENKRQKEGNLLWRAYQLVKKITNLYNMLWGRRFRYPKKSADQLSENWWEEGIGYGWITKFQASLWGERRQSARPWSVVKTWEHWNGKKRRPLEKYSQILEQSWGSNCCWWPWTYKNSPLLLRNLFSVLSACRVKAQKRQQGVTHG